MPRHTVNRRADRKRQLLEGMVILNARKRGQPVPDLDKIVGFVAETKNDFIIELVNCANSAGVTVATELEIKAATIEAKFRSSH